MKVSNRVVSVGLRFVCVFTLTASLCFGAVPRSFSELGGGLIVVLGCGEESAPKVAAELGRSGNTVVHAIASSRDELDAFNRAIVAAEVKGIVTAEGLELAKLPYRDYMVNALIVMDFDRAQADGLTMDEARRCMAPFGTLVICRKGKIEKAESVPVPAEMDVWTHRYYRADGIPDSSDRVFDLPLGFKWNAALPMNFDNPVRAANRYSSTRAMVVDDGRCFSFTEAVYENLGASWKSPYGTNQYLICRDAFNGRFLWQKQVGATYYGGLYIENMAPLVSSGRRLYYAGENGTMPVVDTRTGDTIRELPTTYIPGAIAAAEGIVVAATWKGGKWMGSVKRYDRRRMDWAIEAGTIEAYDDESGKLLWKQDILGTSMLIAEGRVLVVSRAARDEIEENHGRPMEREVEFAQPEEPEADALELEVDKPGSEGPELLPEAEAKPPPVTKVKVKVLRPGKKVVALDLAKGTILWETVEQEIGVPNQRISVEAAGTGTVAVAFGGRGQVKLLDASSGKLLDPETEARVARDFFRYRTHICTPVFLVNGIRLQNRGGSIVKGTENYNFGGARAACLTGTIPAYGAGYIAQNWCNCSPGQIPGLLAVAPIGSEPQPAEMEQAATPVMYAEYDAKRDAAAGESKWLTFRGNSGRSSGAFCEIATNVTVVWSNKVAGALVDGTVRLDWRDYLNSRLTAAALADEMAIVGDIDHNEVVGLYREDGTVVWRYMTAGRVDTAPTIHGGICFVGDHSGYVSALKVKTGELIYRLRIAPDEKRMVSYGKVESVWPVIGGVLVAAGKAYASAGRTQGSDGGLVIRAFTPETGEQLWARALPQKGNGVIEKKPRRNDAMVLENGSLRIMDHRLDPDTGEIVRSAMVIAFEEALAAREGSLGRKLDRREKQKFERAFRGSNTVSEVTMGNEGIYSWNWTRLGHRKFHHIGCGDMKGDVIGWDDRYVAAAESRGGRMRIKSVAGGGAKTYAMPAGYQATALVVCSNAVLQAGSIMDQGDRKGFIRAVGIADGAELWRQTFEKELAFNGLAVDRGEIIACFDDGTVTMLR